MRVSVPIHCMNCDKPSCLYVCPTSATYQRGDRIVDIDYNLCIGCGYCILACPFQVRNIRGIFEGLEAHAAMDTAVRLPDGVCSKCNTCAPKLDEGISLGFRPGVDPEATPECALSCTAKAIHFGDFDDPHSNVSTLVSDNRVGRLQERQGTGPHIFYILQ
jgi:phenylacetyl-CoA:acceptor oxidoreductase 27-kDa subunit